MTTSDVARARAGEAARSVVDTFGDTLAWIPGTHLGRRHWPSRRRPDLIWNYWWQAHYLDAIVDAGLRHARCGNPDAARSYVAQGTELLRSAWLRNGLHFPNQYFDDMAWLVLAAGRLGELRRRLGMKDSRWVASAERWLGRALRSAHTVKLGGGLYWNRHRDRKNVPATAPAAIWFARHGDAARAHALVDWIYANLYDADAGTILDTVFLDGRVEPALYSYNQGTVLGALLELGDPASLSRAAELIGVVDRVLRADPAAPVLRTHGDNDGGLFTGILGRYLAQAAGTERLADDARATAASLVTATADALWAGSEVRLTRRGPARSFSESSTAPAAQTYPAARVIELSTQVQGWTFLEAASVVIDGG